jgi:hypothetical protein
MNDLINQEPKTRKKKLDLTELWTKCQACLEPHNLENLIRHKLPIEDNRGVELHGAFSYIYFCSENCKGLWSS